MNNNKKQKTTKKERSLFVIRLLSKPNATATICKVLLCLLYKIKSGLNASPSIKSGDGNEGRAA